ncbi:MAG TPA: NAD(P)/FAD-dependent oxidoreductase [Pseudomonadales bacterium]|nr:NAD(P)/FAD-dependent oxidoreductase [Pseudomonadales bacterium]
MSQAAILPERDTSAPEHFDVLIVGAGISGVGGAVHLKTQLPGKSFVILENQDGFGGTWKTHKYPGIRSDSDLYTFGYRFKPWTGKPIATAGAILEYMEEVIAEHDLDAHIRYGHVVRSAHWSSEDAVWTLVAEHTGTGEQRTFTCGFLWMCQGYYGHKTPYTPDWPGMDRFEGPIVHPQTWPEDLDYKGKRVLVIGSGATAATIVPAMADDCAHITMLQRSPTYFAPGENRNPLADQLRALEVPEEWIHEIVRRQILADGREIARRSFEEPEGLKAELIGGARAILGEQFDVEKHFTPSYRPWRQRLAFIPEGDLFQGIASGKASVVTDEIDTFTERGVKLKSGEEIAADIIVTATGFDLCVLGDIAFDVDGEAIDFADTTAWRGAMFTGVPNMCWVFGYLRTSWTMRVDLVGDLVCRLLGHMDELGAAAVTPQLRPEERDMVRRPWVEEENFNAGYLMRNIHLMPKQGTHLPWLHTQDYYTDKDDIPAADLDDGTLVYDLRREARRQA